MNNIHYFHDKIRCFSFFSWCLMIVWVEWLDPVNYGWTLMPRKGEGNLRSVATCHCCYWGSIIVGKFSDVFASCGVRRRSGLSGSLTLNSARTATTIPPYHPLPLSSPCSACVYEVELSPELLLLAAVLNGKHPNDNGDRSARIRYQAIPSPSPIRHLHRD